MKPRYLVIHISDSIWGDAKEIDYWHLEKGWGRRDPKTSTTFHIGYHGVILNGHRESLSFYERKLDGKIEPGRPDYLVGAHCPKVNRKSLGVCLIGKPGKGDYPSKRQISALIHWLAVKCGTFSIDPLGVDENGKHYIGQHSDWDAKKPYCASIPEGTLATVRLEVKKRLSL